MSVTFERFLIGFCILLSALSPHMARAQTLTPDTVVTMKAKVLAVISSTERDIPGTTTGTNYQTIKVEVLDGVEKGNDVTVENDFLNMKVGDLFYLTHTVNKLDATDYYSVSEPYRLPQLAILFLIFIGVVLYFGGKQGARGLLSLGASLFAILFLLLPGVLHGYSPILVSVGVASLIVVIGSYVTHGFNKTTSTAILGMITTIFFTGALAYWAIPFAHLSGFTTEEAASLNVDTNGTLDLAGLLVGAILIGTLGVLYDAAIGQAVSVEELADAAPDLTHAQVYKRALRIGREHIGALVNTLAIAYVGASLPLLLLFYGFGSDSIAMNINRELFATEIVRAIVGSIGLVLAVPITTAIATRILVDNK